MRFNAVAGLGPTLLHAGSSMTDKETNAVEMDMVGTSSVEL
jgi:hypothetical protein